MPLVYPQSKALSCHHCGTDKVSDSYCLLCGAHQYSVFDSKNIFKKQYKTHTRLLSKHSILRENYFIDESFWFLPSATLNMYLRALLYGGITLLMSGLFIFSALVTSPGNREIKLFQATTADLQGQNNSHLKEAATEYLRRYPDGKYALQVRQLQAQNETLNWTRELNRVEHLHSYPQRLQGLEMLLKERSTWSPDGLEKLKKRHLHYQRLVISYQKALERAAGHIDREYYSAAIYILKPMLEEGSVLGSIYDEASQLMDKAYLKRINYYLVKANFTQSKRALAEAKQNRVSERAIKELDDKIKRLQALFPKGRGR